VLIALGQPEQAIGMQMGIGAKFGGPSRNSDERSGL
jgi:hypothetical protein